MKRKMKRLLGSIITLVLLICGINYVDELTRLKSSSARDLLYRSYFEYANDYDVLFFGTSHVMYGINPLELWHDYGIVSYNWGSPTCTIPNIYWKLMNVLDYATPDLVVVDCFRTVWIDKSYSVERMHEAFDAFDFSLTKYNAVNDLMDDPRKYSEKDKINVLFRLSAYHNRWEELHRIDFDNSFVDTKGGEFEVNVAVPIEISTTFDKTEITPEMEGVNYLRRTIEACQEGNIHILLTYLPYPTSEEWKKEANMIQDIADEYGVDYINFTNLDVVNYNTDCADDSSHLNISGNGKVTEYLGEYIKENYEILDFRNDDALSLQWNHDYTSYVDWKTSLFNEQDSLLNYLMLLRDAPIECIIDIRNKDIFCSDLYMELLGNLGVDISLISEKTDFILIKNGNTKNVIINNFRENGSVGETDVGEIQIYYSTDNIGQDEIVRNYTIYVDGEKWLAGSMVDDTSMRIVVRQQEDIIDDVKFVYDVNLESTEVSILSVNRV